MSKRRAWTTGVVVIAMLALVIGLGLEYGPFVSPWRISCTYKALLNMITGRDTRVTCQSGVTTLVFMLVATTTRATPIMLSQSAINSSILRLLDLIKPLVQFAGIS